MLTIAKICLEYEYFNSNANGAYLEVNIAYQTKLQMRQNGIRCKQTSCTEWEFMLEDSNNVDLVKDNVFELIFMSTKYSYLRMISPCDYPPDMAHLIYLKDNDVEINEKSILTPIHNKKFSNEICRVSFTAGQAMNRPDCKYTIKFCSPVRYLEYLFFFKDNNDHRGDFLELETSPKDVIRFNPVKRVNTYEPIKKAFSITSLHKVKLLERYDFTMALYDNSAGNTGRKIISRYISMPEPGRYASNDSSIIREICYI